MRSSHHGQPGPSGTDSIILSQNGNDWMLSHGFLIRCRTGSHRSTEVSHDQPERILGAPEKPINYLGNWEKSDLVATPDKEKNHFSLQVNGGPDRDTMSPIKSPARVGIVSTSGIIFFGKCWPARCSRDTAKVAVFRLASSHPDRHGGG